MEYPKALYHCVTVNTAEEEAAARSEGYFMLSEPQNVPVVQVVTEPKKRGRPPKVQDA